MDIDLVFKIAAVGIVVAVLNQLLVRSDRPDQAMLCARMRGRARCQVCSPRRGRCARSSARCR